jgi:hypothetical protein
MKAHPTDKGASRLLGGARDLDVFAFDCDGCPAWRHALEVFAERR